MPKSKSKRKKKQPPPKAKPKVSAPWVVPTFFTLLGAGVLIIILNYVGVPWDTANWRLFLGLGLIAASFGVATQIH
jgi:Kef-type K+ transport system membrane component KefB